MILNENVSDLMQNYVKINENKFESIELALEKICREKGEDEYEPILNLKVKYDILITNEEIKTLKGRKIWIWIIAPFDKSILNDVEKRLITLNLPLFDFIKIIELNGQKYIKYPESKEICAVHKDLIELMYEEHGISIDFLKCHEWEQIQNNKAWIKAQIQIVREFVADKLLKKEQSHFML